MTAASVGNIRPTSIRLTSCSDLPCQCVGGHPTQTGDCYPFRLFRTLSQYQTFLRLPASYRSLFSLSSSPAFLSGLPVLSILTIPQVFDAGFKSLNFLRFSMSSMIAFSLSSCFLLWRLSRSVHDLASVPAEFTVLCLFALKSHRKPVIQL